MLWNGKKYISFTDSRQGTAKISALINIDSENYFTKSRLFHHLSNYYQQNIVVLNEQEREDLKAELEVLKATLPTSPPIIQKSLNATITDIRKQLDEAPQPRQNYKIPWAEMKTKLFNDNDAKNLFYNNCGGNFNFQGSDYCNSLLYNEFARRLPRERSLENLGTVNLIYIGIENLKAPDIAIKLGIADDEWKNYKKEITKSVNDKLKSLEKRYKKQKLTPDLLNFAIAPKNEKKVRRRAIFYDGRWV
jgi:hypothetical protein